MKIIGIDLSGPANHKDTAVIIFNRENDLHLTFETLIEHASDHTILKTIEEASIKGPVVIGIDAPLSYQDGGGYRPQDRLLSDFMRNNGLSSHSVMAPTMTKMAYLTLRGIALSRSIMSMRTAHNIHLVEVHPGAVIGTRLEASTRHHALNYKKQKISLEYIYHWFETQAMQDISPSIMHSTHTIDACAAALGAWHWYDDKLEAKWVFSQTSLTHPFEYCC